MAPGGYTPTYRSTATDGTTEGTCITIDFSYGYGWASTATAGGWTSDWENWAKARRAEWLLFTRGCGWTDGSPVVGRVGVRISRRHRVLPPSMRMRRRKPRGFRLYSLKQLRRLGVI